MGIWTEKRNKKNVFHKFSEAHLEAYKPPKKNPEPLKIPNLTISTSSDSNFFMKEHFEDGNKWMKAKERREEKRRRLKMRSLDCWWWLFGSSLVSRANRQKRNFLGLACHRGNLSKLRIKERLANRVARMRSCRSYLDTLDWINSRFPSVNTNYS